MIVDYSSDYFKNTHYSLTHRAARRDPCSLRGPTHAVQPQPFDLRKRGERHFVDILSRKRGGDGEVTPQRVGVVVQVQNASTIRSTPAVNLRPSACAVSVPYVKARVTRVAPAARHIVPLQVRQASFVEPGDQS